jgi:hypothetical protein
VAIASGMTRTAMLDEGEWLAHATTVRSSAIGSHAMLHVVGVARSQGAVGRSFAWPTDGGLPRGGLALRRSALVPNPSVRIRSSALAAFQPEVVGSIWTEEALRA